MKQVTVLILFVVAALVSCTPVGERTVVSVGYYSVSGETYSELDRQIKLHGPNVTGVGKALASADISMLPTIRYETEAGRCRVASARVNVNARVTLPRHTNERALKKDLAKAWSNLSEYARVHEAVHLAIADRYAVLIEDTVMALPARQNCGLMRKSVAETFATLSKQHHEEQIQFDREEKARIQKLMRASNS